MYKTGKKQILFAVSFNFRTNGDQGPVWKE